MTTILSFLVALGILIAVHEYGHFWVARKVGVKVLRFSLGFGKPLWRKTLGEDKTEFVIAAIPLGGYVKMLDEREGEVAEHEVHRAFNRQSIGKRMAVVVAGPLANFAFAIVAYWLMFMIGVVGLKPIIGEVGVASIAEQGGFQQGDQIVAIQGVGVRTWQDAILTLVDEGLDAEQLSVDVHDRDGTLQYRQLVLNDSVDVTNPEGLLSQFGLSQERLVLEPRMDNVEVNSPAERAGLRHGDLIVSADGQDIAGWGAWVDYVRARPEVSFDVRVMRGEQLVTLTLKPDRIVGEGEEFGRIGVSPIVPEGLMDRYRTEVSFGPIDALLEGMEKTWKTSALTLRMLGKLVVGEASLKNISGPISIAQYAGVSASLGVSPFLAFLALVSISLGVLNLLPVPMLDGGHLLYYFIEFLRGGRPVSERIQMVGQQVGVALLLSLMILAFYNDLLRVL